MARKNVKNVLLVDDEKKIHEALAEYFDSKSYRLISVFDGYEALKKVEEEKVDIVLLDINLPGMSGLETLRELKKIDSQLIVIIITGYGTADTAIDAMKCGCYDYVTKPFRLMEIKNVIEAALIDRAYHKKNRITTSLLPSQAGSIPIIGRSKKMQEVYRLIARVINTDSTVLIQGESGTGKDLVARILHFNGPRANKPFVTVNCAAIPENLLESELFGHEKGVYTGAHIARRGKFEQADGGTIFLDEIGDMSLNTQAKILRVMQSKTFTRIGGEKNIYADVRLIAATNKELRKAMKEGLFREDLFYRLDVLPLTLPSLRERKEDIPDLINYFIARYNESINKKVSFVSPEAMDLLMRHDWPGNVRELEHAIEHAIVLANGYVLLPEHLPDSIKVQAQKNTSISLELGLSLEEVEKFYIQETLKMVSGNQTKAANILRIHRNTLHRLMEKMNIKPTKDDYA
ncbi:MAG: sigma-54 dependent transcriptional regulator [bacterium]|nr:sigma-54 dependent transcriptional regulator [bacterium]